MLNSFEYISFKLKPSQRLSVLLASIHLGAIVCIMPLTFNLMVKIILELFCIISFIWQFCMHGVRCLPWSIIQVSRTPHGWCLLQRNGKTREFPNSKATYCTAYVIILKFSRSIIISSDMLSPAQYRQLLIMLKFA